MTFSDIQYPAETRQAARDAVIREARGPAAPQSVVAQADGVVAHGNPATAFPNTFGPGHFVPDLRACVVDNIVAVIPGAADVCSRLGIPVLKS